MVALCLFGTRTSAATMMTWRGLSKAFPRDVKQVQTENKCEEIEVVGRYFCKIKLFVFPYL